MRKITLLKSFFVVVVLMFASTNVSAQLLVEDFDYTIGSVITATATADPITGWLSHSGNGTANIDVTSGISFPSYAGSGIGGAANLDNNGQDINKTFTSQTTGTVYVAFLIQTQATNSAGYFFILGPSPISSTFYTRLFINGTGNGVGISTSSTAPSSYVSITAGNPTLIVLKHDFSAHNTSLYVLNSFSATEPESANQTISESPTTLGGLALRQYNAAQKIIVDGIRVGTTWADACAAPSGTPKTATPTFTAVPGNVIVAQTVGIESATSGASIYYTTDGTNPNNTGNGTLYSTPISVSSTTTVKAIAYATGYDPSSISTATYTFPTEIPTVAALRTSPTSGFYKLTAEAILTFQSVAGKVKFIQDATAGIVIYDGSSKITTAYNVGDGIKNIYCTLSLYNGTLEIIPFNDPGAANSTGNLVIPVVVTLANIGDYQGQLVTVNNVLITGTGNFAASTTYVINDATAGNLRVAYTDLPYIGSQIPTTAQDITGVVYNYSTTEVDLVPRSAADFTLSTGNENPTITKSIYASNGNILFTSEAGQTVEIFNAVGQKLISRTTFEGLNTIPVKVKGVVFVKLGSEISKVIM